VRADDAEASAAWTPASGGASDVRVGVLTGDPRYSAAIRDAIVAGLQSGRLSARHGRRHPAGVAIIGGGPGDPGLITVRGRQLLAEADVVLTDRLAPRLLLDELRDDVEIIDAGKIPYGRAMAQEHINAALVRHAQAGRFVARLKGGDPFVFGRGAEEVLACLRAGVPVTVVPGVTSAVGVPASAWVPVYVVPGVTSAIAAPAAAGIPVTARGLARSFAVVTAHQAGPGGELADLRGLAGVDTLIVLMGRASLGPLAAQLIEAGRDPATPAACIQSATTPEQRVTRATLATIADAADRDGLQNPVVTVIGAVAALADAELDAVASGSSSVTLAAGA